MSGKAVSDFLRPGMAALPGSPLGFRSLRLRAYRPAGGRARAGGAATGRSPTYAGCHGSANSDGLPCCNPDSIAKGDAGPTPGGDGCPHAAAGTRS